MEKNVGGFDRIARLVLGPVLVVLGIAATAGFYVTVTDTLGTALAVLAVVVGLVFLITAITQKCPLNSLLGMNTYRGDGEEPSAVDDSPRRTA